MRVVAEGGTGWVGGAGDAGYTWVKRIVDFDFDSGELGGGGGGGGGGSGGVVSKVEVGGRGFCVGGFVVGMFKFEIVVPN